MKREVTTGMGVVGVCCRLWATVLVGLVLIKSLFFSLSFFASF